jgi:hypothetical protein
MRELASQQVCFYWLPLRLRESIGVKGSKIYYPRQWKGQLCKLLTWDHQGRVACMHVYSKQARSVGDRSHVHCHRNAAVDTKNKIQWMQTRKGKKHTEFIVTCKGCDQCSGTGRLPRPMWPSGEPILGIL